MPNISIANPIISAAFIVSCQTKKQKSTETKSDELPISVVTETAPLFIAKVLKRMNSAWVIPYTTPQSKTVLSICNLKPFTAKRQTHQTAAPIILNLYTAVLPDKSALCNTTLFREAKTIESKIK